MVTTAITCRTGVDVELIQTVGGDATLAAAAKVLKPDAYAEYLRTHEKASVDGLLRYLMRHRHGTPFEHAFMSFCVRAPIFVWREWHRHRIGQSYNEESARYKQLEPEFYVPPRDRPMIKVEDWKPGRPKFMTLDEYAALETSGCTRCDGFGRVSDGPHRVSEVCSQCKNKAGGRYIPDVEYDAILTDMAAGYADEYARYERQLKRNLDPGLARDNLPVGIYSSCWVSLNPRSCMAFLSLRTHEPEAKFVSYPLYEIEQAARRVESMFAELFPITHSAFNEFGRVAP